MFDIGLVNRYIPPIPPTGKGCGAVRAGAQVRDWHTKGQHCRGSKVPIHGSLRSNAVQNISKNRISMKKRGSNERIGRVAAAGAPGGAEGTFQTRVSGKRFAYRRAGGAG